MSTAIVHSRRLLGMAKSWALKSLPGWSEDAHRDLLARYGATVQGGKVSSLTMNLTQLRAAQDDYERRGWVRQAAPAAQPSQPVPARIKTLVRLWGKLEQAGKLRQSSRAALLAFCARQAKREVRDLDSLTVAECQQITEALKSWLERESA